VDVNLDELPLFVIVALFAVVAFLLYELGYRLGRWWQARTPDKEEQGPAGVIVGAILALMAFLLAVTMGMASDRFDARRSLVLEEANAIGTAYLRADFLPQPYRDRSKELYRQYVPQRIVGSSDPAEVAARIGRSAGILSQLWTVTRAGVAAAGSSDVMALYVEAVNQVIDLHESRIAAGIYARVPQTVLWLLLVGTALSLGMVGYSAGLAGHRSLITMAVLILALGAVLLLVVDLDRSRDGFLQVSQQPLVDLQQQVGPPAVP
jgi:hypothetical protein